MGWVGSVMDMGKTAYQTIQNPESSMLDDEAMQKSQAQRDELQQTTQKAASSRSLSSLAGARSKSDATQAMSSKDFYNQVSGTMDTIGATIEGAATGGWVGAVLGFVSGASKQVIGGVQAKKFARAEKQRLEELKQQQAIKMQNAESELSAISERGTMMLKYGGKKYNKYNTFMSDYSNGLNYFGTGGSHEENPYQGIQVGIDPQGVPNMVEEGESIFQDFVFSERLHPSFAERKQLIKDLGLTKSQIKGKSYSDLAQYLSRESKERPNDPISKAALNKALDRLASSQERCKEAKRQSQALEMFELAPDADKMKMLDLASQQYQQQQQQAAQEQAYQEQLAREQQMQQAAQQGYLTPEQQQQLAQQAQMQGEGLQYAWGGDVNQYGWGSMIAQAVGGMAKSFAGAKNSTQNGKGARTNDAVTAMFDTGKSLFSSMGGSGKGGTATNNLFAGLDAKIDGKLAGLKDKMANSNFVKGAKSMGAQATDTMGNPTEASSGLSTASLDFSAVNSSACGGRINRYADGTIDLNTLTPEQYAALSNEDYNKILKDLEYDTSKVKPYAGSDMNSSIADFGGYDKNTGRYTLDYLKRAKRLQTDDNYFNQFMSSGAFESFQKENKDLWNSLSQEEKRKLAAGLATDFRSSRETPYALSDFHKVLLKNDIHRNRGYKITKDDAGNEVVTEIEGFDPNSYQADEGFGISRIGNPTEGGVTYHDYYYGALPKGENNNQKETIVVKGDPGAGADGGGVFYRPGEESVEEDDSSSIYRGGNRPKSLSTAGRYAPIVTSAIMAATNAQDDFTTPLDRRSYRTAQFNPIQGRMDPNLIDVNWVRAQEDAKTAQAMALASQGNINPMLRTQMLNELLRSGQMGAQDAVNKAYAQNNAELQKVAQFNLDRDKFNATGAYNASRDNMQLNQIDLQRDARIAAQKLQQSENYKDRRDAYMSSLAQGLSDVAKENFFINQWNSNEGVNKGYYINADGTISGADGTVVEGEEKEEEKGRRGRRKSSVIQGASETNTSNMSNEEVMRDLGIGAAAEEKTTGKGKSRRRNRKNLDNEAYIDKSTRMSQDEADYNKEREEIARNYKLTTSKQVGPEDPTDLHTEKYDLPVENTVKIGDKSYTTKQLTDISGKLLPNEDLIKITDEDLGQWVEDGQISEEQAQQIATNRNAYISAGKMSWSDFNKPEKDKTNGKDKGPVIDNSKEPDTLIQAIKKQNAGINDVLSKNLPSEKERYVAPVTEKTVTTEKPVVENKSTFKLEGPAEQEFTNQIVQAAQFKNGVGIAKDLINDALKKGEITKEQANKYKNYLTTEATKLASIDNEYSQENQDKKKKQGEKEQNVLGTDVIDLNQNAHDISAKTKNNSKKLDKNALNATEKVTEEEPEKKEEKPVETTTKTTVKSSTNTNKTTSTNTSKPTITTSKPTNTKKVDNSKAYKDLDKEIDDEITRLEEKGRTNTQLNWQDRKVQDRMRVELANIIAKKKGLQGEDLDEEVDKWLKKKSRTNINRSKSKYYQDKAANLRKRKAQHKRDTDLNQIINMNVSLDSLKNKQRK